MKKLLLIFLLIVLAACSTPSKTPSCPNASVFITLSKDQLKRLGAGVAPFMTDARIAPEHNDEGQTIWRFSNMPSDSIYHYLGLREGDGLYQTNLGVEDSSINLISDLASIPSGKVNCLYVKSEAGQKFIIKINRD